MSRYRMEDGTIIDTDRAAASWDEASDFDGNNHISRATRSQWEHQRLYRSRKGRYYVVHRSQWEGTHPHAEWVSPQEATRWLLLMGRELPPDLLAHSETVSE